MRIPPLAVLGLMACAPLAAQVTESPHTIAPGKVLVEVDGVRLSLDRADAAGNTYDVTALASTIVSAGLTRNVDLQVGLDFFIRESFTIRGRDDHHSGLGDVSFRTKWTFWRDEKRGAALALLPYVKVPTGSSAVAGKAVEGGLIVPWEMDAGAGLKTGAMFQWDVIRNDADNGYDARWLLSGFVERALSSTISVYGETMFTAQSTGSSNWTGQVGAGVLWRLSSRLVLDYELQRGLNRRAAKWEHTWRANWEW
jgi:hypothetical protein